LFASVDCPASEQVFTSYYPFSYFKQKVLRLEKVTLMHWQLCDCQVLFADNEVEHNSMLYNLVI